MRGVFSLFIFGLGAAFFVFLPSSVSATLPDLSIDVSATPTGPGEAEITVDVWNIDTSQSLTWRVKCNTAQPGTWDDETGDSNPGSSETYTYTCNYPLGSTFTVRAEVSQSPNPTFCPTESPEHGSTGSDNSDCTVEDTTTVTVAAPPEPPNIDFTASATEISAGGSVSFFSSNSGGSITSYDWSFGDGGSSNNADPSHTYTTAGVYTVKLEVTGPTGDDDEEKVNYITVNPSGCTPTTSCSVLGCGNTDSCGTFCGVCAGPATSGPPPVGPVCGDGICAQTPQENITNCSADCTPPPQSGGLVPCGGPGQPACQFCHAAVIVTNVLNIFVFPYAPIIAALLFVAAGFLLFLGGGNPGLKTRGKSIIRYTIIGLILLYSAWLIINLVFLFFGNRAWGEIPCSIADIPTISLTANPNSVFTGDPVVLSWNSADATSCMASGEWSGNKAAPSGSETITASSAPGTYTYNLSCNSTGGEASTFATVAVAPACGREGEPCCTSGLMCKDQNLTCITEPGDPLRINDEDTCQDVHRVFTTSQRYTGGSLNGYEGANSICQTTAGSAGMNNRVWNAYITDANSPSISSRIGQSFQYYRIDGKKVGQPNASLNNPLNITEPGQVNMDMGTEITGARRAWIGGSQQTDNCENWTSNDEDDEGDVGDVQDKNDWRGSGSSDQDCDDFEHLYCFEQGIFPPVINNFDVNDAVFADADTLTIEWDVADADTCTAQTVRGTETTQWDGILSSFSGTTTITPPFAEQYVFNLTCSNAGGATAEQIAAWDAPGISLLFKNALDHSFTFPSSLTSGDTWSRNNWEIEREFSGDPDGDGSPNPVHLKWAVFEVGVDDVSLDAGPYKEYRPGVVFTSGDVTGPDIVDSDMFDFSNATLEPGQEIRGCGANCNNSFERPELDLQTVNIPSGIPPGSYRYAFRIYGDFRDGYEANGSADALPYVEGGDILATWRGNITINN